MLRSPLSCGPTRPVTSPLWSFPSEHVSSPLDASMRITRAAGPNCKRPGSASAPPTPTPTAKSLCQTATTNHPFRLRWTGHPQHKWTFAIWLASKDGYENSDLPSGSLIGTVEEAMDFACGLYLGDISAWDLPCQRFALVTRSRNCSSSIEESAMQPCPYCLSARNPLVVRLRARSHIMSNAPWQIPSDRIA
jgi:hypothetical protein